MCNHREPVYYNGRVLTILRFKKEYLQQGGLEQIRQRYRDARG